ncbi:hypothetical protein [Aquimarina aggregata]|uniref:hypothetical protein n=1 Tax=Aquimarina aggregata TaxID=1642818 RepID=UPI00248FECC5|nr:hypothetical protein [Aquimarina aggregata]
MKSFLILLCFFLGSLTNMFSQPSGEEHSVNLKLYFLNCNKEKVEFKKNNKAQFVSLDSKYSLKTYLQGYSYEFRKNEKNDTFQEIIRKDSIIPIDILHKRSNEIKISYNSALQRVGTTERKPFNDVIIVFEYRKKVMSITFKLYNSKGLFEGGSDVIMSIPFKKGNYEVNDSENPILIKAKH